MAKKDQWLIKPGENAKREGVGELVEKLIQEYAETTVNPRNLCLNDNNEAVYFISFADEDSPMNGADVAVFDVHKNEFVFLPEEIAFNLAQTYITHLKYIGEAYDWLSEQAEE